MRLRFVLISLIFLTFLEIASAQETENQLSQGLHHWLSGNKEETIEVSITTTNVVIFTENHHQSFFERLNEGFEEEVRNIKNKFKGWWKKLKNFFEERAEVVETLRNDNAPPPSTPKKVLVLKATIYNLKSPTATGVRPFLGIVATDPKIIPNGTIIYVENYGWALSADIGSAIKGNRIDLWFPKKQGFHLSGKLLEIYIP